MKRWKKQVSQNQNYLVTKMFHTILLRKCIPTLDSFVPETEKLEELEKKNEVGSTSVRETTKTSEVIKSRNENNMKMLFFTSENNQNIVSFHCVKISFLSISDIQ